MPTSLELAGIPKPEYVEFQSLMPLIEGKKKKQYDYIYGAYEPGSQRALISQGFKMIYYPTIEKYRLYNLDTDPMEMNDLADDPKYKGRLDRMIAEFIFMMGRMADPLKG